MRGHGAFRRPDQTTAVALQLRVQRIASRPSSRNATITTRTLRSGWRTSFAPAGRAVPGSTFMYERPSVPSSVKPGGRHRQRQPDREGGLEALPSNILIWRAHLITGRRCAVSPRRSSLQRHLWRLCGLAERWIATPAWVSPRPRRREGASERCDAVHSVQVGQRLRATAMR